MPRAAVTGPVIGSSELTVTGLEAVAFGLLAGGCRLAFTSLAAIRRRQGEMTRIGRRFGHAGGALVRVESDQAAIWFAAGAALAGARTAALVSDSTQGATSLTALDGLSPVVVDVGGTASLGSLAIESAAARVLLAPHTVRAACEAGLAIFREAAALRGPGLIVGAGELMGDLPAPGNLPSPDAPPLPFAHQGPDNPELLLIGAGPGYRACAEARERLEQEGVASAHLHLCQLAPFPGAIIAPVISSASSVLVVEPGGRERLAGLIRRHLSQPAAPFVDLSWPLGLAPTAAEIFQRARGVVSR